MLKVYYKDGGVEEAVQVGWDGGGCQIVEPLSSEQEGNM